MTEFTFTINGTIFSLNESNYRSNIPRVFDEIKSLSQGLVSSSSNHPYLMEYGVPFIGSLKSNILSQCERSNDFGGFINQLGGLLKIDAMIFRNNSFLLSDKESDISKILNTFTLEVEERLAIVIEAYSEKYASLYENEIRSSLIELIVYIKDGSLYDKNNSTTPDVRAYLDWIKNYNVFNIKRYNNCYGYKQQFASKEVIDKLTKHWERKKSFHWITFVILAALIFCLTCVGCNVLQSWIITGNSAFDSCCEQMSFANLLYGAVVHWGFQYKVILLVIWFAAIGQLIQLIKSQWHLINDASERMAIIDTYQTFANNKILGDTGRFMDVLLQSVFRASDDGLLKDAKTTFPSSLSDLASKIEK